MKLSLTGILVAASLTIPAISMAQQYPSRPVRVVVPAAPGGVTDQITRFVQPKLQEALGQTVVVENKPGAGGLLAANDVAHSPPDGYSLLLVFDTHAVNHLLHPTAPDPFKSFDHLMLLATTPSAFVASNGFQPNTVSELVARAKAAPDTVTYGSTGSGTSNHLAMKVFEQRAGIQARHVPYKGGGAIIQALLRSEIDVAFIASSLMVPHIQAGKVKALGVGSAKRVNKLPNVPSVAETYPGYTYFTWLGLVGPKNMPQAVKDVLLNSIKRALDDPTTKQRLTDAGFDVDGRGPVEFQNFVADESVMLGKIIRDAGVKVE